MIQSNQDEDLTDFDRIHQGKAVSLLPVKADIAASDYMTVEEEAAEAEARAMRKRAKDTKFKKKKKKDKKKRRKTTVDSDEENEEDSSPTAVSSSDNGESKPSILDQLEATADPKADAGHRKRRRNSDDQEDMQVDPTETSINPKKNGDATLGDKRSKYEEVMAKGNERTKQAFAEPTKVASKIRIQEDGDDDPDDSFLNAALAKARRLNRLKSLNQTNVPKGAEAVTAALQSGSAMTNQKDGNEEKKGIISFAIDDTREFTLALGARAQQKEREAEKARQQKRNQSNVVISKNNGTDKGMLQ